MHYNKNLTSILLVQSSLSDQMDFIAALENIEDGFLFGMASTGSEAIDLLQRSMILPDLIFLDLSLTKCGDCLREIQTDPLTNEIPIIVFVRSPEEKMIALREGARAVLFKSDQQQEFRDKIENLLHTWSRRSSQSIKSRDPEK